MRHLLADWNNWSRMERLLALALLGCTCLALAAPIIL
jgi:hypothetical protein